MASNESKGGSAPESRSSAADPAELSRRPLSADRRLLAAIVAAALGLALAYAWLFHLREGAVQAGPSLLQYALITAYVLLLVAVMFYLLRYLIRLLSERRAGIIGSRFKFKLVATFIGLCFVPAMVLYAVAIVILNAAVDRALAPDVRQMVRDAKAVERQFHDDALAGLASDAHGIADRVAGGLPADEAGLRARLAGLVAAERIDIAEAWLRPGGEPLRFVTAAMAGKHSPLEPPYTSSLQLESDLVKVWRGGKFERMIPVEQKLYLVAGTPLVNPGGEPSAALIVVRRVPADLAERVKRLGEQAREHDRIKAEAPWVKRDQQLMFATLSMVIILGATWVGHYISRGITIPIQRLAEGTRELRRGNLSHVVTWKGRDELADLVDAFNGMARDLGAKAQEVERKAAEIEGANLELARANVEVERRRSQVEMLLETMTAGVIAVDDSGVVTVANRAARQILQLPDSSRPGVHHHDFLPGMPLADLREAIDHAIVRRTARRELSADLALDRGPVSLQVVLTAQPDGDGRRGVLALFEDVTELVRAQKLATWRAAARRIAHEIKNPLTPIQLSAQRILKKFREGAPDLPEVLEGGVETIIAEVSGLKQMVDEFSDFARMPEVRPVPSDVAAMLESVRALYEGHEGLALTVVVEPGLRAVPFDPELLRRAVVNLVDNAVDATRGQGCIEMRARLDQDMATAIIEVIDDGPGVPAADKERLFLPYFTTRKEGTGLGLAIVNRIVTDHGGRVRVEDNRPRGSRFVIEVPSEPPIRAAGGQPSQGGDVAAPVIP